MTTAASVRERISSTVRKLLASRLLSDLVSRSFGGNIPSRGLRFRTDNPAIGDRTAAELFFRLYERHEIAFIRQHMLTQWDVLEFGAGIGVTGSHVLSRLNCDRRLISVEANEALLRTLRRNLERHRGVHEVHVVHGAVSYSGSRRVTLEQSAEHMRSRLAGPSNSSAAVGGPVPAVTLGEIVAKFDLGNYVLICDIEGAERDIISRDVGALATCRQLIIELHGQASEIEHMSGSLTDLGFVLSAQRKTVYVFTRHAI